MEEVVSSASSVKAEAFGSSDDLDPEEDGEAETKVVRKKKNKRRKGNYCRKHTCKKDEILEGSIMSHCNHHFSVFTIISIFCVNRKQ